MTNALRKQIKKALADPILQPALDGNAERRIRVRNEAMATLENPGALRKQAHLMRAEVIAHLDTYLEEFTRHLKENGMVVHSCNSGADAVQKVLEIAQNSGARRIAKSKTMLGEEIDLNPALEQAGLEVVETDLGEYIVQLRGEAPAHIITPAVHLTRKQVGELFHEKLGLPFTEDIPTMTAAARKALRQVFLDAEIGISGVNVGVAETGAIMLLTNEGNGRMVTTLPRVHIALMGIERLVAKMDDAAMILRLLPRSATGQKLTVYTSIINGPRRANETEGPQERHLILVDNGRSALRQSPLAEILYCIRCGACLNACPVFREMGGHAYVGADGRHTPYPGPIGSVISPGLFGQANFGNLARASTLCGACKEACPVDIDLPKLLLQVRAGGMRPSKAPDKNVPFVLKTGLKLFAFGASHPRIWRMVQRSLGLVARVYSPAREWMHLPAFSGWGYSKDFPRPALKPFSAQAKSYSTTVGATPVKSRSEPTHLEEAPESHIQPTVEVTSEFIREAQAVGTHVIETSRAELVRTITGIAQEKGIEEICAWEKDLVEGLTGELAGSIKISLQPGPNHRLGLTGATLACAETGSLLIAGGNGRPLTASLLPEIHIAILHRGQIVPKLEDMLRHESLRNEAALAVVTGPSRTADIEMTLTIGVHGPGEVYVLLID